MKAKSLVLLLAGTMGVGALWAQQATDMSTRAKEAAKPVAAGPATTAPAKAAAAKPAASPAVKTEPIDGDWAYKVNCSRCHAAPRKFSERQQATIMQHMRVRANLTQAETDAILRYLTR